MDTINLAKLLINKLLQQLHIVISRNSKGCKITQLRLLMFRGKMSLHLRSCIEHNEF